LAAEGVVSVKG